MKKSLFLITILLVMFLNFSLLIFLSNPRLFFYDQYYFQLLFFVIIYFTLYFALKKELTKEGLNAHYLNRKYLIVKLKTLEDVIQQNNLEEINQNCYLFTEETLQKLVKPKIERKLFPIVLCYSNGEVTVKNKNPTLKNPLGFISVLLLLKYLVDNNVITIKSF